MVDLCLKGAASSGLPSGIRGRGGAPVGAVKLTKFGMAPADPVEGGSLATAFTSILGRDWLVRGELQFLILVQSAQSLVVSL